jgi:hypothetical protein
MLEAVAALGLGEAVEHGPTTDHSASTVRADALFRSHLNFENTSSIGLKSGLYGGK